MEYFVLKNTIKPFHQKLGVNLKLLYFYAVRVSHGYILKQVVVLSKK